MPTARAATDRFNRRMVEIARATGWAEWLALIPEPGACAVCLGAAGAYRIAGRAPAPVAGCQRAGGCTCWIAVIWPAPALPVSGPAERRHALAA